MQTNPIEEKNQELIKMSRNTGGGLINIPLLINLVRDNQREIDSKEFALKLNKFEKQIREQIEMY